MNNSFTPADTRWFKEFLSVFDEVNLRSDTSACMRCPDPALGVEPKELMKED
jgi:hypothetical protein